MRYRVRLSLPALVEVVVDLDAESQQEAIVAGYDHAMAATPKNVTVVTVNPQSAMLEACDPISAVATVPDTQDTATPAIAEPAAPAAPKRYAVKFFNTPESLELAQPDKEEPLDEYNDAVALCRALADDKDGYVRRVHDKFGNKLFEMKNEIGLYVVVAYPTEPTFAARTYTPWSGWHKTAKDAKKQALALLEAGKVYAVGVVDATKPTPVFIMNLTRSSS